MGFVWQRPEWPLFRWDAAALITPLAEARLRHGVLLGRLHPIGADMRLNTEADALVDDAMGTARIEGETLSRGSVRASARRRLGMDDGGTGPDDRRVDGLVAMLIDATRRSDVPLDAARLHGWHAGLFPMGFSGIEKITVAGWRPGPEPMQVVSGPQHRPVVHFEAPPACRVPAEMDAFLAWFNDDRAAAALDPVLRAGLAHLWFLTIHPCEDGNGRIGRALSDMVLARGDGSRERFFSLSRVIQRRKKAYWDILEATQRGDGEITPWLLWFVDAYHQAIREAEAAIAGVLRRAAILDEARRRQGSECQVQLLARMLEDGWRGHMTTSKYVKLAKVSEKTAQRDIAELMEAGFLVRNEGGSKNTSYRLAQAAAVPANPRSRRRGPASRA